MRGHQFSEDSPTSSFLLLGKLWQRLSPILGANRQRVGLALLCLLAAKAGLLCIPFLLKSLVDGLDTNADQLALQVVLLLVVAYGAERFSNTLFGELRDTLFGRVTEKALHSIGLQTFRHVHSLDIDYHLNRRTGGLARISSAVPKASVFAAFFIFNIAPTLFEIAMVAILLLFNYGAEYVGVIVVSVFLYGSFRFSNALADPVRARVNAADSESNTRAVDSLLNYETVKYFNNEIFEAKRYDASLDVWEPARRKIACRCLPKRRASAHYCCQPNPDARYGRVSVNQGTMTLGDFILVNQFMLQLYMPLGFLGFVYREIKGAMANIEGV